MHGSPNYPGTPRWVKVSAAVAGILLLAAIAVAMFGGEEHSLRRHLSATTDDAGSAAWAIGERIRP